MYKFVPISMRQINIAAVFLIISSYSCVDERVNNELLKSYEISVRILTDNIHRYGNVIKKMHYDRPDMMGFFYLEWKKIDSLTLEIELFVSDSTSEEYALDFHSRQSNSINVILTSFYDYIDSAQSEDYIEIRQRGVKELAQHFDFSSPQEIKNSQFPALFAASNLLLNLDELTQRIINMISAGDFYFDVQTLWSITGTRYVDTTVLEITSKNFYDWTRNGMFKIDWLKDSKGNIIRRFDSKPDDVVWQVRIPGKPDSVYYISGAVYNNIVFEFDTFVDKKVMIATANNK